MVDLLLDFQNAILAQRVASRVSKDRYEPFPIRDKDISSYTNAVVDASMKLDGATHKPKEFYSSGADLAKALGEVFQQSNDSAIHDDFIAISKKLSVRSEDFANE